MYATDEQIFLDQFNYHAPTPLHLVRIERVRSAVKDLAAVLYQVLPNGPDKSAAIRQLRETMMTANAAIVLGPGEIELPAERVAVRALTDNQRFLQSEPE